MTTLHNTRFIDTTDCDREPIHVPGSVQNHGVLLASTSESWTVTHASANAAELLRKKPAKLLGSSMADLLGATNIEALTSAQQRARDGISAIGRVLGARIKGVSGKFDLALHTFAGQRIVEIEPTDARSAVPPLDLVGAILARLRDSRTIVELCADTAAEVRQLIGYDRVVVYRFLEDGSGQVIAESGNGELETLMGLRYPASDIPRQARDLYRKNWIRLIADVGSSPSPIVQADGATPHHLDLSFADLRSVSPIHIRYLENMRVGASMSISIIVGGELWGLIACHHRTARRVPANMRAAAELLGQVFSLQIQTVDGMEAYVTMRAARALLDRVVAEFPIDGELVENVASRLEQLGSFIPCDGAGVLVDGVWRTTGSAPYAGEAHALARFCDQRRASGIFASDQLCKDYAPARDWHSAACGVMAIPLSHSNSDWLFFFRKELPHVVTWAGDPDKSASDGNGTALSPRSSFAAWKQQVRGQSAPWTARHRLIGETLRVYLLDIILRFSEIIREERRQAEQRQRLQTSQLNHRVKGTLELIQSLVHLGFDGDLDVREFVTTLEGRIKALALAHDAVSTSGGSQLRHLVETAIAPHAAYNTEIRLDGPDVALDPKACCILALVLHELSTGSATSGALSDAGSKLSVFWQYRSGEGLLLMWEERITGARQTATDDGLRLQIIKRNIPHALGGTAKLEREGNKLTATFTVPDRYIQGPPAQISVVDTRQRSFPQRARELADSVILVLEDNLPAALDLERLLYAHGAANVIVAGTESAALPAVTHTPPDLALLDVDLGDGDCLAIADLLARAGVPFVFGGTDADLAMIPDRFDNVARLTKPYTSDRIISVLHEALLPSLIRAVLNKML